MKDIKIKQFSGPKEITSGIGSVLPMLGMIQK